MTGSEAGKNAHFWDAAQNQWSYPREKSVQALEAYGPKLPWVGAVLDGLTVCSYHAYNVHGYEKEIVDYIKTHPPKQGQPTAGIFYVNKVAIEYQSFILAEHQLFNYFSWAIGLTLELTKEGDKEWGFGRLYKQLKENKKLSPKILEILDVFFASNPDSNTVVRDKIAHYFPLIPPQVELTISGWGSVSLRYIGFAVTEKSKTHEIYPAADAIGFMNALFSPSKEVLIQNPIAPLLHKRLMAYQQLVEEIFQTLTV
jgi:hypothetical protein